MPTYHIHELNPQVKVAILFSPFTNQNLLIFTRPFSEVWGRSI